MRTIALMLALQAQAPAWIDELDGRVAKIRVALEGARWSDAESEARELRRAVEASAATWSETLENSRQRQLLADLVTHVRELAGVVEARARDQALYRAGVCDTLLEELSAGGSSGR